ncbi:NPCBM/NEW2 domain-containing protein [Anatilimnocola sp. NA78]|uniref:NPCBM/NEW2 domain-containing protein n=1 Tax=Anatilimnocola sp. NA78 TaxID=3415683 RepID=UPI003CE4D113
MSACFVNCRWLVCGALGLLLTSAGVGPFDSGQFAVAQSPQELIASQVPAAVKIIDAYHGEVPVAAKERTLHLIYWTPADREPQPEYRGRLSRVLLDIQDFYRKEMKRLGFGERTIRLATETDGLLKIHLVRGTKPYDEYHVQSGRAIREECLPTLQAAKIDPAKETIVIFCNMSNWDEKAATMSQNSPYYASGGLRNGTAWQVDSPLLDSALLSKKEPMLRDGQYGRISVGRYNSIFVGGVCHELGHALGLPHNRERPDERAAFGTALMGSGNRTYGDERRGEGRGSFLTLGEGLRLASHPLFTGSTKGIDLPANAKLTDVQVKPAADSKSFEFSATVSADPPAYAVIGYMDPSGGSDYDATTITAVPDEAGKIKLNCAALQPGKAGSLRLVVCQANGGRIGDQVLAIPYVVAENGKVDLSSYQAKSRLVPLTSALTANKADDVAAELKKLEQAASDTASDRRLLEVAQSLAATMRQTTGPIAAEAEGDACWLSDCQWQSARVGWKRPMANRLPNETLALLVGGQLFARGLYAHAPSSYTFQLGGKWKRLSGQAGLADGNDGSVVFVIQGDGKELWRSKKISDASLPTFDVDVSTVQELKLIVEDAGNGTASDWGVWVSPQLKR